MLRAREAALFERDVEKILAMFADDAVVTTSSGRRLIGKDQIRAWVKDQTDRSQREEAGPRLERQISRGKRADLATLHRSAVAAFGVALAVAAAGTVRPAEVVRRSCRVGGIAALLLPIVSIAVLVLWESSAGRRDLGMGGLMLYSMPIVAFGVALVLALVLWLCDRSAAKRLRQGDSR